MQIPEQAKLTLKGHHQMISIPGHQKPGGMVVPHDLHSIIIKSLPHWKNGLTRSPVASTTPATHAREEGPSLHGKVGAGDPFVKRQRAAAGLLLAKSDEASHERIFFSGSRACEEGKAMRQTQTLAPAGQSDPTGLDLLS